MRSAYIARLPLSKADGDAFRVHLCLSVFDVCFECHACGGFTEPNVFGAFLLLLCPVKDSMLRVSKISGGRRRLNDLHEEEDAAR